MVPSTSLTLFSLALYCTRTEQANKSIQWRVLHNPGTDDLFCGLTSQLCRALNRLVNVTDHWDVFGAHDSCPERFGRFALSDPAICAQF